MSDLRERALDFTRKLKSNLSELEIPEFGFTAYYYPVTFYESRKISERSKAKNKGEESIHDTVIYTLIEKLLDENGDKIFTLVDENILNDCPFELLFSVYNAVNARPEPDELEEDIKKTTTEA